MAAMSIRVLYRNLCSWCAISNQRNYFPPQHHGGQKRNRAIRAMHWAAPISAEMEPIKLRRPSLHRSEPLPTLPWLHHVVECIELIPRQMVQKAAWA